MKQITGCLFVSGGESGKHWEQKEQAVLFGYFLSVLFDRWTEDNCHSYQLHLQNYFVLQNL